MDGHPPSFPPDERALSPPLEGLAERTLMRPLLSLVPTSAIPPVPVPSELDLDSRGGVGKISRLLPDLRLEQGAAQELLASRDRAWVQVRLGAAALPSALAMIEQSLEGRDPNLVLSSESLDVYFTVGDYSDWAWLKVANMAWAIGDLLGGGAPSVTELHIRAVDVSARLDSIPHEYRQPEDYQSR